MLSLPRLPTATRQILVFAVLMQRKWSTLTSSYGRKEAGCLGKGGPLTKPFMKWSTFELRFLPCSNPDLQTLTLLQHKQGCADKECKFLHVCCVQDISTGIAGQALCWLAQADTALTPPALGWVWRSPGWGEGFAFARVAAQVFRGIPYIL